jgi:hypothetical protein
VLVFSGSKCHDRGSFRRCTLPWLPCSAGRGLPTLTHLRRLAMNYAISVAVGVLVIILLVLLILHFA